MFCFSVKGILMNNYLKMWRVKEGGGGKFKDRLESM